MIDLVRIIFCLATILLSIEIVKEIVLEIEFRIIRNKYKKEIEETFNELLKKIGEDENE